MVGIKKTTTPAIAFFTSDDVANFIAVSSLDIIAYPNSKLPKTISIIGINIFKICKHIPII